MNWDDLRIARAVYETGSFAAAGARLRINETTVARRLGRLQEDLGVTLFEAIDGARRPTTECHEVVALAALMAGHAESIAMIGSPEKSEIGLVGRRRIATTDSVATEVLAPNVPRFLAENPGMALDFLASTENVNFSRWEADIALRLAKPERGDFIIAKLADVPLFLIEPAEKAEGGSDVICAYPDDLDGTPESRFLAQSGLKGRVRCTTKNLIVVKKLVQTQQCSGVLPWFMCADLVDDPALTVRELPEPREVWLLVQPHLKDDKPTRAVIDWARECFAAIERPADRP